MAPWAMPTAWDPMVGRLRSSVCMAMVKPLPSSPIRWLPGTRTPSKEIPAVGLPRRPILSSWVAISTPHSGLDQEAADAPAPASGSVTANTV